MKAAVFASLLNRKTHRAFEQKAAARGRYGDERLLLG